MFQSSVKDRSCDRLLKIHGVVLKKVKLLWCITVFSVCEALI